MAAKTSTKKPSIAEVLKVLESMYGAPPSAERESDPLIDHLMVAVLTVHAGEPAARAAVRALSEAFLDFNEVRVSPLFELEKILDPHIPADVRRQAAADMRMALQDVYDGTPRAGSRAAARADPRGAAGLPQAPSQHPRRPRRGRLPDRRRPQEHGLRPPRGAPAQALRPRAAQHHASARPRRPRAPDQGSRTHALRVARGRRRAPLREGLRPQAPVLQAPRARQGQGARDP